MENNLTQPKKERIWELDAFRGLFILCVIVIHTVFDLQYFFNININTPKAYDFVQEYGGILFIIISGICVTLGTKFLKRGLIVFGAGMVITLVTYGMYKLNMADSGIIIYFGVLHLIGICMILYGLFKHFKTWMLIICSALFIILGIYFETLHSSSMWFVVFGITPLSFATGDYFPLFPNLGWFTFGIFLGRTIYKNRKSLMPKVNSDFFIIRFFRFCGRHSLIIYLVHQPLVYGILTLAGMLI